MDKVCQGWKFTSNHLSDDDGRIIIIWKDPASVRVLHESRQTITCEVKIGNLVQFVFTAVYASNLREERSDLWVELLNLQQSFALDTCPWLVGGDFNQITHYEEHSSPSVNSLTPPMIEFKDCLSQLDLFDLRFQGPFFTWSNNQPSAPIAKKLDRVLVNNFWITSFPDSTTTFLPPVPSDHAPSLVDLSFQLPKAGSRPFKFFNYLTKHPNFLQLVEEVWIQAGSFAYNLKDLCWKQKTIKGDLKHLNRENFSKIQERVSEANRLLMDMQVQALQNPSQITFQLERDLHDKWDFLRVIEESYFKQKSRINWLKEGDLNTSYFHKICQSMASFNTIRSFLLDSGDLLVDPIAMSNHAVSHFQSILAPNHVHGSTIWSSQDWLQSLNPFRCSLQQSQSMLAVPTSSEIMKVMLKLNPNKASGPDGLTSGFYKAAWGILGPEVTASISHFFQSAFLPASTNATILTLVPKRPGASKIVDYRPIACLNTLYKVVSKLLVSRIKPILPSLILPNQTAFVKDRLLLENTILAGEIVNGYHKANGPKRVCIKVDIAKAFDTLSWDFLFSCLKGIQIPDQYLRWLQACICTTNFTIGYNGMVHGYFKVQNVLSVLQEFEQRSGLAISLQKSSFFAGGLSEAEVNLIKVTTGLTHGCLPVRYLGVPLCTKKLTIQDCEPLLQQVKAKINNWCVRSLSFAGRLLLINTVIAGISNFWCSSFVLPKLCIRKIHSLCSAFLWKGSLEGHHSARVSWETVTKPKEQGGLGIRDLIYWNKACTIKLIWLLFFQSGSVWVAWIKLHFLRGSLNSFWTMKRRQNFSWLANKLLKYREEAFKWIKLRVGNGITCRFWTDNWSPYGKMLDFLPSTRVSRFGIPQDATLHQLFNQGRWQIPHARSDNQVSLQIFFTTMTLTDSDDHYEWELEGKIHCRYSTGHVYYLLREQSPKVPWKIAVWNTGGIPKHSFLMWLLVLNRCPTRDRLLSWGLNTDSSCLLCNSSPESRNHIFFNCSFTWTVWSSIAFRCGLQPLNCWDNTLSHMQSLRGPKEKRRLTLLAWQCTIYLLWNERNARLHRQTFRSTDILIRLIDSVIRNKIATYRDSHNSIASSMLQLWLSTA
ncbi:unnamed protein product [Arabidopsis halleri]